MDPEEKGAGEAQGLRQHSRRHQVHRQEEEDEVLILTMKWHAWV